MDGRLGCQMSREPRLLLRTTEGIRDWHQLISQLSCSPAPMATTEEFWAARRARDSQELERWLLARRRAGPWTEAAKRSDEARERPAGVERKSSDSGNSSLGARCRLFPLNPHLRPALTEAGWPDPGRQPSSGPLAPVPWSWRETIPALPGGGSSIRGETRRSKASVTGAG